MGAMSTASDASFECCGVRIDAVAADAAVGAVIGLAQRATGSAVHLCNAYTLSIADRNDAYRDTLNRSELNLADGAPVAWLARRLGLDLRGPVRGKDLLVSVIDAGRARGLRHFLYGSTSEVVTLAKAALVRDYPGALIVGTEAPPFRPLTQLETEGLLRRLESVRPDLVWVGLGTPKQDEFAEGMKRLFPAGFVAVGAAFDFAAGTKPEAPSWLHGTGLEWLHRLATEPRRLWRRYLLGNTVFVLGAIRSMRSRTHTA